MEPSVVITRLAEGGAITAGIGVMPGTADSQCKLPTGAGVRILGVALVGATAAALPLSIVVLGIVRAVAKSAIAPGDPVNVNGSDGKFKKSNPNAAVTEVVAGYALTSATNEDDEFEMIVCPSSLQPSN